MSVRPIADRSVLRKSAKKLFPLFTLLVVALAACQPAPGPAAAPTEVLGTTRQPVATAMPPATAMPAAAMVNVATDAKLGKILVDAKGMTLYLFTKDTNGTSVCYDQCATAWPPLLTSGAPVAGDGVTGKLGVTTRKDGAQQVTYDGWPLYYYFTDKQPGDTTGQNVGGVWFVVPPAGAMPVPAVVNVATDAKLGKILVDAKGMTLYLFTKDTGSTSTCYDQCATNWPPLLTTGAPVAGAGATGTLGVTARKDGSQQVTYDGVPLYYFAKDAKPGDTTGQEVGGVWFVVPPAGSAQATPAPTDDDTGYGNDTGGQAAGTVTLMVGETDALGKFIVDAKGMTLYLYTKDTANTSTCYDTCAANWPPLLVAAGSNPVAQDDASGKLGVTTRTDGTRQVTYDGWPLYYFIKDAKAGDTNGQGVGGVWFVVPPTGVQTPAPAPAP